MQPVPNPNPKETDIRLAPAWRDFIRFCRDLKHGEIERLSIQDGVPVVAELTRKRVRFTRER
jgi:hypothetical protein